VLDIISEVRSALTYVLQMNDDDDNNDDDDLSSFLDGHSLTY